MLSAGQTNKDDMVIEGKEKVLFFKRRKIEDLLLAHTTYSACHI